MLLAKATTYALKALALMAREPDNTYFPVSKLAKELDISPTYLAKVLQRLVEPGLLKSTTGPGGGFALAKKSEKISLYDAMLLLEPEDTMKQCVLGWVACSGTNPCPVHDVWAEYKDKMIKQMSDTDLDRISKTNWLSNNKK